MAASSIEPAADADVITAYALVAAGRGSRPDLNPTPDGSAAAALAQETVSPRPPGPWPPRGHDPGAVNPSYVVIPSISRLADSRRARSGATSPPRPGRRHWSPSTRPSSGLGDRRRRAATSRPRPHPTAGAQIRTRRRPQIFSSPSTATAGRHLAARAWPFLASEAERSRPLRVDGSPG